MEPSSRPLKSLEIYSPQKQSKRQISALSPSSSKTLYSPTNEGRLLSISVNDLGSIDTKKEYFNIEELKSEISDRKKRHSQRDKEIDELLQHEVQLSNLKSESKEPLETLPNIISHQISTEPQPGYFFCKDCVKKFCLII